MLEKSKDEQIFKKHQKLWQVAAILVSNNRYQNQQ